MVSVTELNAVLPKTQCEACGYKGCKPYAEAILKQEESIALCAPGGESTLRRIAKRLHRDPAPSIEQVHRNYRPPSTAVIRASECIGCTKCLQACPVDAIIGSRKQMHTIIENECTGCGLCVPPCPVDCIDLIPIETPLFDPIIAEQRFNARQKRLNKAKPSIPLNASKIKAELKAVLERKRTKTSHES